MAGLPGAGKTEFVDSLIEELNLKVVQIDMDEIDELTGGQYDRGELESEIPA